MLASGAPRIWSTLLCFVWVAVVAVVSRPLAPSLVLLTSDDFCSSASSTNTTHTHTHTIVTHTLSLLSLSFSHRFLSFTMASASNTPAAAAAASATTTTTAEAPREGEVCERGTHTRHTHAHTPHTRTHTWTYERCFVPRHGEERRPRNPPSLSLPSSTSLSPLLSISLYLSRDCGIAHVHTLFDTLQGRPCPIAAPLRFPCVSFASSLSSPPSLFRLFPPLSPLIQRDQQPHAPLLAH